MTIRHLRLFLAVYNKRSMTEAARALYMTQPSVSQAIMELEDYYGVTLFERLSHRLYPTIAADSLFAYANKILGLFDEMEQSLKQEGQTEQLRIGANYSVGAAMVGRFVKRLSESYPNAEISVVVNKATVLKEMIRQDELDLALFEEQPRQKDLIQEFFCKDKVAVVVSPESNLAAEEEVTPEKIAKERFLLREKGAGTRDQFEQCMNRAGYQIKPYWESISVTALLGAVKEGAGIAVLPYEAVKEEVKEKKLKELHVQTLCLDRRLAVVYHKNKYHTKIMQDFIDICHKSILQEKI